jgi:hypothetical protein
VAGEVLDASAGPLLEGIRSARDRVVIAAPYLSLPVARDISRAALASRADTKHLLTALNDNAVRGGFLDPTGLLLLRESNFEIRSARNLHAKVVLIDGKSGIIGSGNLTTAGVGAEKRRNLELGVRLQPAQAQSAEQITKRWWTKAKPVSRNTLDRYIAMKPAAKGGRGGGYGSFIYEEDDDLPKERRAGTTGLWLKMLYHHTRRDRANWWRQVDWISDGRPPPSPQHLVGGPQYEEGDLIVFYLVELDGAIRCCPALAEVTSEPDYDPEYVRLHAFTGDEKQWPWVTKVKVLDSTSLDSAPTLVDLKVDPKSTERRGRLVLQPEQLEVARARIAAAP